MGKIRQTNTRSARRRSRSAVIDAMLREVSQEHAAELEALAAEYFADNPDATPEERIQIDILIHSQWTTRCLWAVETRIWNEEMTHVKDPNLAQAEVWIKRSADYTRIQSRTSAAQNAFHKALRELLRLRAARGAERNAAPARKSSDSQSKLYNLAEMPTSGPWIQ
jgi:hypothetical protein